MTVTSERPARTFGLGRLAAAWRSGPLGGPGFRLLTIGQFTSTIGDYCYAIALPWLVLSGGGSASSLGIVLACYGIPRALLMVPAGNVADRLGPRRVMLAADFARCALTAVFAVLAATHVSSLAALAPVAVLLGAFSAMFTPASMAMMPSLVEPARLTSANAVYTGFTQAGSMLGPVIGGVLVAATGPATAFGADAGSYLVSAVTLAFIPAVSVTAPAGTAPAGTGPAADAQAVPATSPGEATGASEPASAPASAGAVPGSAWALLRQSRVLQIIMVVVLSANFALVGTTEVALPALAHARFGADGYGAVLTCLAVAALLGALIVGKVGDRFRPVTLVAGALLAGGTAIAAAPFIGGLPGVAAGMAVFGIASGFDNVVSVTMIQRWAPPALLGRVWGLLMLASMGSFPVAAFIAGLLVRHLGPTPLFPISGALLALSMLFGLANRDFRAFGTDRKGDAKPAAGGLSTAGHGGLPALRCDIRDPRCGWCALRTACCCYQRRLCATGRKSVLFAREGYVGRKAYKTNTAFRALHQVPRTDPDARASRNVANNPPGVRGGALTLTVSAGWGRKSNCRADCGARAWRPCAPQSACHRIDPWCSGRGLRRAAEAITETAGSRPFPCHSPWS